MWLTQALSTALPTSHYIIIKSQKDPLPLYIQIRWSSQPFSLHNTRSSSNQQTLKFSIEKKKMWRMLRPRKSPRVADETMLNGAHPLPMFVHGMNRRSRRDALNLAFSIIYTVVRVPVEVFSCFSQPHVNGAADGSWVSGEFTQISEMNHLMVSDSLRYAILM